MKQIYIYFGVLLALLLLPGGTDAAKLAPAQLVCVQTDGQTVRIRTDLGNLGNGRTLSDAFADLENTTPGKVFLDTADYLVVDENSIGYLPDLAQWVKGDCLVCIGKGIEDLSGAATYLDSHPPGVKLEDCQGGNKALPYLTENDERFCLKGQIF